MVMHWFGKFTRCAVVVVVFFIIAAPMIGCSSGGGGDDSDSEDSEQFSGSCTLRITNGAQCEIGSGPVVLLELLDQADDLVATCTGAFISPRHVLAAAHCFEHAIAANVRFGSQSIRSQAVAVPPQYQPTDQVSPFDFSVVTLSENADGVEILPILVSEPVVKGDLLNIIGFGKDEDGNSALQGNEYVEALKKGTMIVSEVDNSLRAFAAEFSSTGQSICSGDSGGPAIVINRDGLPGIAGVAQAIADPQAVTEPVCLEGSISVFTSVQNSANLQFIQNIVSTLGLI